MNSCAATLAASNRLPSIELLVSIASTAVRRTVVSVSAVSAVALAFLPSTVTLTPSRSTSASAGTDTRIWTEPGLVSTCAIEPSAASAADGREGEADRGQRGEGAGRDARSGRS